MLGLGLGLGLGIVLTNWRRELGASCIKSMGMREFSRQRVKSRAEVSHSISIRD